MSELDENSVVNELTETLKTLTNTTKVVELRNIFVKKYLTPLYAQIASAPTEEKAKIGQTAENLKRKIFKIIDEKMVSVAANNPTHQVNYDITLNTSDFAAGGLNPITLVIDEIATYFRKLNFTIQSGQEVLDIKYGFDHLNISEHHPSRDTSETFYVSDTHILRTQNTSSSAMFMENNSHHDIRIMNYGSVYRNDDDDATHSHQFNQVDFVWIRSGINIKNLKWVIDGLIKHLFGAKVKTRYRLSNFPFTEPSFEVDCSCPFCGGKGCNRCKQTGWIELLGAGLFNRPTLRAAKINIPTGIAAGIGVERIAMMKYNITDIRDLYNNDFRFIKQFTKKGGN